MQRAAMAMPHPEGLATAQQWVSFWRWDGLPQTFLRVHECVAVLVTASSLFSRGWGCGMAVRLRAELP